MASERSWLPFHPLVCVTKNPALWARRETNSMVEEFMLLANISVAQRIYREFPDCAMLRKHPAPPPSNYDILHKASRSKVRGLYFTFSRPSASGFQLFPPPASRMWRSAPTRPRRWRTPWTRPAWTASSTSTRCCASWPRAA